MHACDELQHPVEKFQLRRFHYFGTEYRVLKCFAFKWLLNVASDIFHLTFS